VAGVSEHDDLFRFMLGEKPAADESGWTPGDPDAVGPVETVKHSFGPDGHTRSVERGDEVLVEREPRGTIAQARELFRRLRQRKQ
jgi:hypothetical protein